MIVYISFLDTLYGISYGFDIKPDLLVMAWHFTDIAILCVIIILYVIYIFYIKCILYT